MVLARSGLCELGRLILFSGIGGSFLSMIGASALGLTETRTEPPPHEKPVAVFRTRDSPNSIGLRRETFLGFASEFSGGRYYRFRPVPSA
jgi:hypothetical protein